MTGSHSDWHQQSIDEHFETLQKVIQAAQMQCADDIMAGAEVIASAFQNGNKLLICGNGGSAADSQHLASEFTNRLDSAFSRPALPAIALTTDTSFLTSYANDEDFEGVFRRQVEALGRSGDVLLGISTSGQSRNVIEALKHARESGLRAIGLTGSGGKESAKHCDVWIAIPSDVTRHVQEASLVVEHLLCHIVERMLFDDQGPR